MRRAGLRALVVRVYRAIPGLHRFSTQHPNRLGRRPPRRANRVWLGDTTHLPVGRKWRFLAVVTGQGSEPELIAELDRRLAEFEADPTEGRPGAEVIARIRATLR